jgi:hypothetical protein
MSATAFHIHTKQCQFLHAAENFALKHPYLAHGLAIPIAAAFILEKIIISPAITGESLYKIGRNIVQLSSTREVATRSRLKEEIGRQAWDILNGLINTVAMPILGIVFSIPIAVLITLSPQKQIKEFAAFNDRTAMLSDPTLHIDSQQKFYLDCALYQFKEKVQKANDEELRGLHFIETPRAKAEMLKEIQLKAQIENESKKVRDNLAIEIGDNAEKLRKLDRMYAKYRNKLGLTPMEQLYTLNKFAPSMKDLEPVGAAAT